MLELIVNFNLWCRVLNTVFFLPELTTRSNLIE